MYGGFNEASQGDPNIELTEGFQGGEGRGGEGRASLKLNYPA